MDIYIMVGSKQYRAVAKRITASGAAIIYTASGPVEIPRERWKEIGAGDTAVQGDMLLPANDRVEGRDACGASLSHAGLCPGASSEN